MIDSRLLKDARENLEGANSIIDAIKASGGYHFRDELCSRTGMRAQELKEYVSKASATFRRVTIEISVACFLLKECSMSDRTFERFTELVQEVITAMQARQEIGIAGGAQPAESPVQ